MALECSFLIHLPRAAVNIAKSTRAEGGMEIGIISLKKITSRIFACYIRSMQRGLIRVLFREATGHNKKNVRANGCDGRAHMRCQSAEECFAMLELIDALIS